MMQTPSRNISSVWHEIMPEESKKKAHRGNVTQVKDDHGL